MPEPRLLISNHRSLTPQSLHSWLDGLLTDHHFRVHFSYDGPAPPDWGPQDRIIDEFHMVMVKSGRGAYAIGDDVCPLMPGRFVFVSPQVRHSAFEDHSDRPHLLTCRFGLYTSAEGTFRGTIEEPVAFVATLGDTPKFEALFEALFRHFTMPTDPIRSQVRNSIATQIVSELILDLRTPQSRLDPRIERVRDYLWRHPDARPDSDALAQMAGLSKKHLFAKFAEQVGTTPLDYHIRARCHRARHQLLETSLTVKEIAYGLGYPNQYAFSKQFKQRIGTSPSEYRTRTAIGG